jgi:tetratricopeptide (TPR) repeat protein
MNKKKIVLAGLAACMMTMPAMAQTRTEWRDSLTRLNDSIRLKPYDTDLRLRKAAVNIELEQWDYAAEEYARVLQIEPKNLAALYYRAYVNTMLRRYDLAKVDYESFLSILPKNFEAQLGLAMVKRKIGHSVDALDEMNRLVQVFPDSALAYAARAGYEAELKQYELALYDWDEAIKRAPNNKEYKVSKVDVLISLKHYDEAWRLLEDLMRQGVPKAALKEWIDKCK